MAWPAVILGVLLNLLQSACAHDVGDVLHEMRVTGVLGEHVYLSCLYTGKHKIIVSSWNRVDSSRSSTKVAGFKYDGTAFNKPSFSTPASVSNLTVKVSVDGLDMEGVYTCIFTSDEFDRKESLFLSVIAQPSISTRVDEEVVDGTQYQTASCTASHGKPLALISWDTQGSIAAGEVFSMTSTNSTHDNGTSSVTSLLRFPVARNNQSSVTCVVRHPAWPEARAVPVELDTFVSPTVTMEMRLVQKEGEDLVETECRATGGRPHPHITWVFPTYAEAPPPHSCGEGLQSVASCRWFPPYLFEGENITCVFGYSIIPAAQTRTATLPAYYLTALQLKHDSVELSSDNTSSVLTLDEGDRDIIIAMEILGNVPSYEISCTKDGEALPEAMAVLGSELFIRGPADGGLIGQYHCHASYHKHAASLQLEIQVNPKILLPVSSPPNVSVTLREQGDTTYIECLALDSVPVSNVSWVLPQDLNSTVKSAVTSSNGSHSVRSVLTLPACWPRALTLQCVVEHPDVAGTETRKVLLPSCVRASVTLRSRSVWEDGVARMVLKCLADGVTPEANITWTTDCQRGLTALRASGQQQGLRAQVWSSVRLSVLSYAGCAVICTLDQDGLKGQMQQSINIPLIGPSEIHVRVGPQSDPTLWAAVCAYRSHAGPANISWVVPDPNSTTVRPRIRVQYENMTVLATSTYKFHLRQHEGKDLTCVIQNDYEDLEKTIHVPRFSISSVVLLNNTGAVRGGRGQQPGLTRVVLQAALAHQSLVFKVNGNTSEYKFACFRADGSLAATVATVLLFAEPVSERDAGLYSCHATWNHHKAALFIQVDVSSEETPVLTFIIICFSSASAIILIMIFPLCVLCKQSRGSCSSVQGRKQQHEALAALMQGSRSPELPEAEFSGESAQEYAELVRYSIVIDVKSTV